MKVTSSTGPTVNHQGGGGAQYTNKRMQNKFIWQNR